MIVSVHHDPKLQYPGGEDNFSPDQAWPEYRLGQISSKPNPVYAAVRACLANAGLDRENYGKPEWNPLGKYVSPGQKVFLLCNFVEQRVKGTREDFFGKCTHASVIRAMLDYTLIALKGSGRVLFGNAPLQGANWEAVTEQTGATQLAQFYSKLNSGVNVHLVDLRQHIMRRSAFGDVTTDFHSDADDATVKVSMDGDSLLEQLYEGNKTPKFRVLDYNHRRTEKCHEHKKHTYIINRKIIESDVVISIPKLKTHEKVGITCGIKGCVGMVAHKDCLAHHRFGPPKNGGDEIPDSLAPLRFISAIHDKVYSREAGFVRSVMHSVDFYSRKVIRRFTRALSGSWPGNDTCWRMAVDLARIVKFADKSGKMQLQQQRHHLMLTDGIIGGEGDGPLSPKAVPLGYLSFADDVVVGDYANALVMGIDPHKLPMIARAVGLPKFSLSDYEPAKSSIQFNGREEPMTRLQNGLGKKFRPATEWVETL